MSSNYMTEMFYGKPEPVWVINNRRRNMGGSMGVVTDPYYPSSRMTSGSYGGQGHEYNNRGTSLVPDITVRTLMQGMTDVARIKHVLSVEGVYNVVCDIPQQTITVSSNLSPRIVVGLIRQAMGTASIINYVDPLQPTFESPGMTMGMGQRSRYSSYDDSYSYDGRTGYAPAFTAPYNGRSYDNEFRPSSYSRRSSYGSTYY
jgi:hypothetical protein